MSKLKEFFGHIYFSFAGMKSGVSIGMALNRNDFDRVLTEYRKLETLSSKWGITTDEAREAILDSIHDVARDSFQEQMLIQMWEQNL